MKILADRKSLLAAFATAANFAPTRPSVAICQGVKLDASKDSATLTATDMECGVQATLDGVSVTKPGSAILPRDQFAAILRESTDDELRLTATARHIEVAGQRDIYKLPANNPDDFPALDGLACEWKTSRKCLTGDFASALRRTEFSSCVESSRFAFGGVRLEWTAESLTCIATDGRRLAKHECQLLPGPPELPPGAIVAHRAVELMLKSLAGEGEIELTCSHNYFAARTAKCVYISRLVEGRFPRWQDVIPARNNPRIELTAGTLAKAIKRAGLVLTKETRGLDFKCEDGTLTIAATVAERGESTVALPIAYDAEAIVIRLNSDYVTDFLKALDPEQTVTLDFHKNEAALLLADSGASQYVVMPMNRD